MNCRKKQYATVFKSQICRLTKKQRASKTLFPIFKKAKK